MSQRARVWLVEDDQLFREAFQRLLETTEDFDLEDAFESFEDLKAALATVPPRPVAELVVMDLNLPGANGLKAIAELRSLFSDLAMVVLSSRDSAEDVFDALRAGACGYLVKGARPKTILAALKQAGLGGTYFSPSVARHVLGHFGGSQLEEPLTERELEVLRAIAAGKTKAQIAEQLFLSPHTVDSHVRNLYRKLHVRSAAEAAAKGVRSGLV